MPPTYTTELWLPGAPPDVFRHVTDISRLDAITPPWLSIRVVPHGRVVLKPGAHIDYAIRLAGVPFRWRTEITAWEPPHAFAERQARGPFVSWAQTHVFEPHAGCTVVRERMEYRVPLGAPMDAWCVRPLLVAIQAHRARRLAATFDGDAAPAGRPPAPARAGGGR
jgi:ligand-binding SRPBCC domain-containing protein